MRGQGSLSGQDFDFRDGHLMGVMSLWSNWIIPRNLLLHLNPAIYNNSGTSKDYQIYSSEGHNLGKIIYENISHQTSSLSPQSTSRPSTARALAAHSRRHFRAAARRPRPAARAAKSRTPRIRRSRRRKRRSYDLTSYNISFYNIVIAISLLVLNGILRT